MSACLSVLFGTILRANTNAKQIPDRVGTLDKIMEVVSAQDMRILTINMQRDDPKTPPNKVVAQLELGLWAPLLLALSAL